MEALDLSLPEGRFALRPAWSRAEVGSATQSLLDRFADRLPADRGARVVIKPNLNNDLPALTGNSTDLRLIDALLAALRDRGYHHLTVADGSNVGVARRGINVARRLRLDRLLLRHGARFVDLNQDRGDMVVLRNGARPRVAATITEAELLLSLPTVKTHAEAGLSCAMKNWVGVTIGQDKRHMHRDLGGNIFALSEVLRPHLILVDGLVGMEGNGPGDGDPVKIGFVAAGDDPVLVDFLIAGLVGIDWQTVPALRAAEVAGRRSPALALPRLATLRPPPPRSALARLADARPLHALKVALRPLTQRPAVAALAKRAQVIQDVYSLEDDGVTGLHREAARCGDCDRCVAFCPTGLSLAEIGARPEPAGCVGCLYCYWACPKGAITLDGPLHHLQGQIARYKLEIERL